MKSKRMDFHGFRLAGKIGDRFLVPAFAHQNRIEPVNRPRRRSVNLGAEARSPLQGSLGREIAFDSIYVNDPEKVCHSHLTLFGLSIIVPLRFRPLFVLEASAANNARDNGERWNRDKAALRTNRADGGADAIENHPATSARA